MGSLKTGRLDSQGKMDLGWADSDGHHDVSHMLVPPPLTPVHREPATRLSDTLYARIIFTDIYTVLTARPTLFACLTNINSLNPYEQPCV